MLTREYILLNWEQDFNEAIYFTMTSDGDSLIYDIENDQFYFNNYRTAISRYEASELLEQYA